MIWCLMAFCNPRAILLRAQHIQGCLNVIEDSLSRRDKIIQTEWFLQDFSGDLPNLAQTNGRYVCNQNEQQTTSLSISNPRCIEYLMGGTRRLCLLSNSSHTKNDSKDENLCLPNDCSSPRVARDELVLGSNRTFHKTPTITSTLGNSSQTAFQSEVPSKSPISQSTCLASRFENKSPQKFSFSGRDN